MILRNSRTGAVLAHDVERASTALARLRGLLGRSALPDGQALLIEPSASIHTFFMRFTIDAAFLSHELRVLRAIPDLGPWRATRIHRGAAMALELPRGTLVRTGTREGDALQLES
jgi:uncharacterized membrane protein (UPF0127 family)